MGAKANFIITNSFDILIFFLLIKQDAQRPIYYQMMDIGKNKDFKPVAMIYKKQMKLLQQNEFNRDKILHAVMVIFNEDRWLVAVSRLSLDVLFVKDFRT